MKLTKTQLKASNPLNSVWVSASAGTGKTHVLIIRFLRLLLAGNNISSILCLTYTKAAAQEMKERVFAKLKEWSFLNKKELKQELLNLGEEENNLLDAKINLAKNLFSNSIEQISYIKIQTIHSFCASVLSQFPLEANIITNFSTLESNNDLLKQALITLLNNKKQKQAIEYYVKDIENISSFLEFKQSFGACKLVDIVNSVALKDTLINKESYTNYLQNLANVLLISPNKTSSDIENEFNSYLTSKELEANLAKITSLEAEVKGSNLKKYIVNIKEFLKLTKENNTRFLNKDLVIKGLITNPNKKDDNRLRINSKIFTKADEKLNLTNTLTAIVNSLINYEEKILKYSYYHNIVAKIEFAFLVNQEYEELKFKKSVLDHDDILNKTLALFTKASDIMPWVFYKLDSKINHIMVDEAQDTNKTQWEIIKHLTSNFFVNTSSNNTIFVVGDIKQSIYSFQGANPDCFNDMFNYFKRQLNNINKELLFLSLNTSFRSSCTVTSFTEFFCNTVFNKEIPYYKKEDFTHNCSKKDEEGFIEFWPLLVKNESKQEDSKEPDFILASKIANEIQYLVREKNVLPGNIIVCAERRTDNKSLDVFKYLRRFLRQKKISCKASDRVNLAKSIFMQDMIALASFLAQVLDDYALATLLKSPIFNLSNNDLFNIKAFNKEKNLWHSLRLNNNYKDIVEVLLALLKETDVFSPYHIFSNLLYKHKILNNYVSRLGKACLDEIELFLDLCIEFENTQSSYAMDLFVEFLDNNLNTNIKQEESEKSNQVIISTIHYFKGLEAKYVFLIDNQEKPSQKEEFFVASNESNKFLFTSNKNIMPLNPLLLSAYKQQENAQSYEKQRKYYVAITRAINGLYICSYKNKASDEVYYLGDFTKSSLLSYGFKEIVKENTFKITSGFMQNSVLKISNNITTSNSKIKQEQAKQIEPLSINETWVDEVFNMVEEPTESESIVINKEATELGIYVHKILDTIANYSLSEIKDNLSSLIDALDCSNSTKQVVKEHILNVINSSFYKKMLSFKVFTEADLVSLNNNSLLLKRADSFYIENNNIHIIDYKTSNKIIKAEYKEQLLFYKKQFASIFPNYNIYCYLFFTKDASVEKLV